MLLPFNRGVYYAKSRLLCDTPRLITSLQFCLNVITLLFVQSRLSISRLWRKPKQAKANYRGVPTHACPCGEKVFIVHATFDDYEISMYGLNVECSACGALLTAPCEVDRDGCV